MSLLYNIAVRGYYCLIVISSYFNRKAKLWIEGRRSVFDKINAALKPGEKFVWFHCASLGEFEQGRTLIEEFRNAYPGYKIILTFFSPSGYEVRKNYKGADYIFYLPLDTRSNAERFIDTVNPEKVFFIKYEFWFNYLNILKQRNIPTYLISGIFRKDQHFFKWYGAWFRKQLNNFSHFFVQDQGSQTLLNSIGITNTLVSGDTRFDRVSFIAENVESIPLIEKFRKNKKVLIAGSTWNEDENMLVQLINSVEFATYNLKIIIAPHEISETNIKTLLAALAKGNNQLRSCRYSLLSEAIAEEIQVLIIDNIGMLSSVYQYADIAYIGGGFGKGIHNVLEAAVFGMPVVFGPNYKRFREASDLLQSGGAFCTTSYDEFEYTIKQILENNHVLKKASEVCGNYVMKKKGATDKIMKYLSVG